MTKVRQASSLRERVHEIIFEADTWAGKAFDVVLLVMIVASIVVVSLESIEDYRLAYFDIFFALEWFFTVIFTLEYALRLYSIRRPMAYALSFFGIIDILSILPAYLSLFMSGTHALLAIRVLRLLRIFRIFKLGNFLKESNIIMRSMQASRTKITVFLFFVCLLVTVLGALMYLVEGSTNKGFSSIPRSIYWAVVTVTTVGFGDITPQTPWGQLVAVVMMIIGYAVIAVPTGIVSAEMSAQMRKEHTDHISTQACRSCATEGHDSDALYCKRCGFLLNDAGEGGNAKGVHGFSYKK